MNRVNGLEPDSGGRMKPRDNGREEMPDGGLAVIRTPRDGADRVGDMVINMGGTADNVYLSHGFVRIHGIF